MLTKGWVVNKKSVHHHRSAFCANKYGLAKTGEVNVKQQVRYVDTSEDRELEIQNLKVVESV